MTRERRAPHHGRLDSSRRPAPPRWFTLAALAAALAGCAPETSYIPRTPHVLALAMTRGQPALYKDGALIELDDLTPADVACAATAGPDAAETASETHRYRRDSVIGGVGEVLLFLFPPAGAVGLFFAVRATGHQHRANAHLVDAINRYNDEPGCRS